MDKENRHIDHIFKEGLHDFEMQPTGALWENIADRLPEKKKKRSLIVLFPLGIAASLILLFSILYSNKNTAVIDIEPQLTFEEDTPCPLIIDEKTIEETIIVAVDESTNTPKSKNSISTNISKKSIAKKERFSNQEESALHSKNIAYTHTKEKEIPIVNSSSENDSHSLNNIPQVPENIIEQPLHNELVENNSFPPLDTLPKIKESLEKQNTKKWSIQPQLAQLNYASLRGNSTFGNNISTQEFNTSLSYGVKIAYHPTDRLAIRGGLSSTQITVNTPLQSSFDFSAVQGFVGHPDFNIISDATIESETPEPSSDSGLDNDGFNIPDAPEGRDEENDNPSRPAFVQGEFEQQISYIEIPLEVSYKLIDKRVSLSLISGISTFVLVENESNATFQNGLIRGFDNSINNLNPTVFSNNFGIGLHYNINKTIKFNLEPTVKIQWNAFNSETNFRPYIFGIYSGISFQL